MKAMLIALFILISYDSSYSADHSIRELWRKDIYNYDPSKDSLKSELDFDNQILITDVNNDRIPEIMVSTGRYPEVNPAKGKVLTLNGANGDLIWERTFDCGILDLCRIKLRDTSAVFILGDSSKDYFLDPGDGHILKEITTEKGNNYDKFALSSMGNLVASFDWGTNLQMLNPATFEKIWEVRSETKVPNGEKMGFLAPVLADMNADGVDDAIMIDHWALILSVFDGRDGKQLWRANLARKEYKSDLKKKLSGDIVYTPPCVIDMDGNGEKGVVVGTFGGAISIFSGKDGSNIFYSQLSQDNPLKKEVPALYKLFIPRLPKGGMILFLVSVDLNNDGFLDIIGACYDQKIYAIDGKSKQVLWQTMTDPYKKENQLLSQPAIADMDGDGNPDVVVFNSAGDLFCIKGSDGIIMWKQPVKEAEGVTESSIYVADLNGDGRIELVIPYSKKGEVLVYTTNAPCKPGEIIWGMLSYNPQHNTVVRKP